MADSVVHPSKISKASTNHTKFMLNVDCIVIMTFKGVFETFLDSKKAFLFFHNLYKKITIFIVIVD